MKKLQTFEAKFKTVNQADFGDSWNVGNMMNKHKDKKITGKKRLDLVLGGKVIELLTEYNLFVSVGDYQWLNKSNLVLESEKKFKEYRVELGTKTSFDMWLDYEYTGVEFDDLSVDKQLEYEAEYDRVEPDSNTDIEFSVFLPVGVNELKKSAMCEASNYLYTLSKTLPEVYNGYLESSGVLGDNPDGFKKFLKYKELTITNNNVEDVTNGIQFL